MKDSYLIAGMRFNPLVRLLTRNRISLTPRSITRILFLFQSACWSSLFSLIEKRRYRSSFRRITLPKDPVFIIGHWRTGSTFLHQLMARDPNLTAPTLFQVALPDNFLVSYRFYRPLLSLLMGPTRPMDNVKIGMNEPQEDEYALFRLTTHSPLEQLIFPAKKEYFIHAAQMIPEEADRQEWSDKLLGFYQKIYFRTGRQIVSKNPFNSYRIPWLANLFPESRFIHIVRHPFAVVPSTRHLWSIVQPQNILNKNGYIPDVKEISQVIVDLMATIHHDLGTLEPGRFTELRYEDLEKDPVGTLQRIYRQVNLPYTESFERNMKNFLVELASFHKNVYLLSEQEKNEIQEILYPQMERYHYVKNE